MTETLEFQPWPKVARLNRDITITEKLDGTNAAVVIVPAISGMGLGRGRIDQMLAENPNRTIIEYFGAERFLEESDAVALVGDFAVYAQSRRSFIAPGRDNYGFAGWVQRNAEALVATLGEGTHFGEWWGAGIQRKYGLTGPDKRFSLFNTAKWGKEVVWIGDATTPAMGGIPGLGVVPVLYEGPFDQQAIWKTQRYLEEYGSLAVPGFAKPEGIVIFHHASREMYKVTLEGDQPTPEERRRKHAGDLEESVKLAQDLAKYAYRTDEEAA